MKDSLCSHASLAVVMHKGTIYNHALDSLGAADAKPETPSANTINDV